MFYFFYLLFIYLGGRGSSLILYKVPITHFLVVISKTEKNYFFHFYTDTAAHTGFSSNDHAIDEDAPASAIRSDEPLRGDTSEEKMQEYQAISGNSNDFPIEV